MPDATDACPGTASSSLTDRRGCSASQSAGCRVQLDAPADGERVEDAAYLRWTGTCDLYRVQVSHDPDFPAGATRTLWTGAGQELRVEALDEPYWRVEGGMEGHRTGAVTPARSLKW